MSLTEMTGVQHTHISISYVGDSKDQCFAFLFSLLQNKEERGTGLEEEIV